MQKRSFIRLIGGGAITCLTSCVATAPPPRNPSEQAWQQYIYYSPFSYRTDNSPKIVALISRKTSAIPLEGVRPFVADHIRAVEKWTQDFPVYLARANAAATVAYERGMVLEEPVAWVGEKVGSRVADDGQKDIGSWLKRLIGGEVGDALGRWAVRAYSQHSANAAFYRVMNPLFERGRQLSYDEHRINQRLNQPTTDYLRRLIGAI